MCYAVKCSVCGKTTWDGCGSHVLSVYKRIPEGLHCHCREWPGVKPGDHSSSDVSQSQPFSSCTIL